MLECVANVSEGRDAAVLALLADACGTSLLDLHADVDHHRSVFTLAGPGSDDAEEAARRLATAVARHVSIADHEGAHPRVGALDVVPFVTIDGLAPDVSTPSCRAAADAAVSFARWWSETFDVPVFFYDEASASRTTLPEVRRAAFRTLSPDLGPLTPHALLGATAVGARRPLVALNCELESNDVDAARRVARAVREASGGLAGVRALGLQLASRGRAQVALNLVRLETTGVEQAVGRVRELCAGEHIAVTRVELVGLIPRSELERCSDAFLAWSGLEDSCTIEHRLAGAAAHPQAEAIPRRASAR